MSAGGICVIALWRGLCFVFSEYSSLFVPVVFKGIDCLTRTEFRSMCLCLGLPAGVVPAEEFERLSHASVEQHVGWFSLLVLLWTLLGALHHVLSTEY